MSNKSINERCLTHCYVGKSRFFFLSCYINIWWEYYHVGVLFCFERPFILITYYYIILFTTLDSVKLWSNGSSCSMTSIILLAKRPNTKKWIKQCFVLFYFNSILFKCFIFYKPLLFSTFLKSNDRFLPLYCFYRYHRN